MSTVAEITEAIPRLSAPELRAVEVTMLRALRERNASVMFDDASGTSSGDELEAVNEGIAAVLEAPKARR
jgi:hypothetical protein